MSWLWKVPLALVSGIISTWAYYHIAIWLKWSDPQFLAVSIMATIFIHELGHWLASEHYGVRSHMVFLVIIGGVGPSGKKMIERFKALNSHQKSVVYLAGVTMNLVLVIVAAMLSLLELITIEQAGRIANLNAVLIFFNLIPFLAMDGQRFLQVFFDSVPEHRDFNYVLIIITFVLLTNMVFLVLTGNDLFIWIILLYFLLRRRAVKDDPNGSSDPKAMTPPVYRAWVAYYIFLLLASQAIYALTPVWSGVVKK